MTKENETSGGPAFPHIDIIDENGQGQTYEGLTKREYAAIHLKQPNSGEPWLDDMIRQAKRDEFAGMALRGLLSDHRNTHDLNDPLDKELAKASYAMANAMMEGRE